MLLRVVRRNTYEIGTAPSAHGRSRSGRVPTHGEQRGVVTRAAQDVAKVVQGPEDRFLAAWADAERSCDFAFLLSDSTNENALAIVAHLSEEAKAEIGMPCRGTRTLARSLVGPQKATSSKDAGRAW